MLARYALVEEGDYFEVLGVSRDASDDEVQQAHDRIARELAPDAIDPALAGELGAKLDAIREVVGEALRVLGRQAPAAALPESPGVNRWPEDAMTPAAGGILRLARVRGAVAARARGGPATLLAVVSQPDRPAGAGRRRRRPP